VPLPAVIFTDVPFAFMCKQKTYLVSACGPSIALLQARWREIIWGQGASGGLKYFFTERLPSVSICATRSAITKPLPAMSQAFPEES
jgi:hypothetical protein